MAKIKCFIKHCKVSRNTNSALVRHLHQNHSKTQREKAPKEKYSELLYDLCECGFKKLVCKNCGANHLKESPKDLSLERKSDLKKNISMDTDNLPSLESILSVSVRIHSLRIDKSNSLIIIDIIPNRRLSIINFSIDFVNK